MTNSPPINLVSGPSFPGLSYKSFVFVFDKLPSKKIWYLAHSPSWSVIQKFWCKEKPFPCQGNSQWCLILRKLVTETHPKFYFSPLSAPFRKWGISANLVPSLTIRKANFPEWWLGWKSVCTNPLMPNTDNKSQKTLWQKCNKGNESNCT